MNLPDIILDLTDEDDPIDDISRAAMIHNGTHDATAMNTPTKSAISFAFILLPPFALRHHGRLARIARQNARLCPPLISQRTLVEHCAIVR